MSAKTSDWRPGPTVCRCCLAEGCYKDISTEYFWMGKREVYAEMLSETMSISIAYSKAGGPNSNSRLICEPCISRLRDASDFKRQVLECEKTFMNYLDAGTSGLQKEESEVKIERVKLEKQHSDDDDGFDDEPAVDFIIENNDEDDDDDLDDEPLMKLATKVPKKEIDVEELINSTVSKELTIKRKSASTSKEPPAKKGKKQITLKARPAPKATASTAKEKTEKKKKEDNDPTRSNAETILRYTTACPFRVNDRALLCVYCCELFDEPEPFREHMANEHNECSLKIVFHNLPKSEFIKADLTDLSCRLCSQRLHDLDTVAQHLKTHGHAIDPNGKLGVMPYKLRKDVFNCAVCQKSLPSLHQLNRHTITHFFSYVCHVCGSSYIATTGLLKHLRSKHQEYEAWCRRCCKKFPSMEAKERHTRTVKSCMPYSCPRCPDRFLSSYQRRRHIETTHGQLRKAQRCADCNIDFTTDKAYYNHFKLHHSDNCAICKHCGMKFVSPYRLKRHLAKHNL